MKAIHHLYIVAATLVALTACADNDDCLSAFRNDPNAVRFRAQVGNASGGFDTRSNPLGNTEQQAKFNTGDEISVGANDQEAAIYRYDADKQEWTPKQGDKYLKWVSSEMDFKAYYPVSFTGTVSQPSAYNNMEDLQAADYMLFDGKCNNTNGKNITLPMARQMARVVVEIAGFGNEYPEDTEVNTVKVGADGVAAFKHDGKFYALMKPCSANAGGHFLELSVGTENEQKTLTGIPELKSGMSYTYRLTVGKDKLTLQGVSMKPWTEKTISDTEVGQAPEVSDGVITMRAAGTLLASDIQAALGNTGHDLKITGPMNNDDFKVLRTYLTDLNIDENGTPVDIDFSDAEVETIPEKAFYQLGTSSEVDCYYIGEVALPKILKTIGNEAFYKCKNLQITNWSDLTNLSTIGSWAFNNCGLKDSDITLPDLVTQIGVYAFSGTGVKSVSFPNNVTLDVSCFSWCSNLETITFRGDVTFNTKYYQFGNCTKLTTIDISHSTTVPDAKREDNYIEIPDGGSYLDEKDIFYYTSRGNITVKVPAGKKQAFLDAGWTDFKEIIER